LAAWLLAQGWEGCMRSRDTADLTYLNYVPILGVEYRNMAFIDII